MYLIILLLCITCSVCYAEEDKPLTPYEQMVKDRDARFELQAQRQHEINLEIAKIKALAEMKQSTEVNIEITNNSEANASSIAEANRKIRKVGKYND